MTHDPRLRTSEEIKAPKPPKARARIKKRSRTKGGRGSDPAKSAWIHTLPCLIWTKRGYAAQCVGFVEAHHDRPGGARASDKRTVPLCPEHHRTGSQSVEQLGRHQFQAYHRIHLDTETARYETEWQLVKRARRLMVGLRELKALIP